MGYKRLTGRRWRDGYRTGGHGACRAYLVIGELATLLHLAGSIPVGAVVDREPARLCPTELGLAAAAVRAPLLCISPLHTVKKEA
jgi:hypothetical protein